jgi:hypothetical protein
VGGKSSTRPSGHDFAHRRAKLTHTSGIVPGTRQPTRPNATSHGSWLWEAVWEAPSRRNRSAPDSGGAARAAACAPNRPAPRHRSVDQSRPSPETATTDAPLHKNSPPARVTIPRPAAIGRSRQASQGAQGMVANPLARNRGCHMEENSTARGGASSTSSTLKLPPASPNRKQSPEKLSGRQIGSRENVHSSTPPKWQGVRGGEHHCLLHLRFINTLLVISYIKSTVAGIALALTAFRKRRGWQRGVVRAAHGLESQQFGPSNLFG